MDKYFIIILLPFWHWLIKIHLFCKFLRKFIHMWAKIIFVFWMNYNLPPFVLSFLFFPLFFLGKERKKVSANLLLVQKNVDFSKYSKYIWLFYIFSLIVIAFNHLCFFPFYIVCHSFSILKAIAIIFTILFAIVFKSQKRWQLLLLQ